MGIQKCHMLDHVVQEPREVGGITYITAKLYNGLHRDLKKSYR